MHLKDYLKKNRITQAEFAQKSGYTQGYLSRVINGLESLSGLAALEVSEATNFTVTPHELNPILFRNPTDGLPAEYQNNTKGI